MTKKLHAESSQSVLADNLACFGATPSGECFSYNTEDPVGPQAVLVIRGETPTEIFVDLICNRTAIGVTSGDFVLTGPATFGSLSGAGQLFHVRLTKNGFGTVSLSLSLGFAQDADGTNFPAVGPVTRVLSRRPIPTITGPAQVSFDAVELSIDFDESVTGLSLADFYVIDGTLSNLTGSGDAYTADFEVAVGETNPQVVLPFGKCQNLGGFDNVASNIYSPIVAHVRPTPTVTPIRQIFPTAAVKFYIDWSVPVAGSFVSGHIDITNGSLDSLTQITTSRFLASVTATGDVTVTLTIDADQFTVTGYAPNASGTANCQVSTSGLIFTLTPPGSAQDQVFNVAVTGSQSNDGLSADKFQIANGYAQSWTPSGNGGTLTVAPVRYQDEYDILITLPEAVTRAPSGVYNSKAGPVTVRFDDVGPVVTFGTPYREGAAVIFPVSLDEPGVVAGSYSYPAGNSTAITGEHQGFLITIDPIADKTSIIVELPEGLFEDAVGNPSLAVTSQPYLFDRVGPVLTMSLFPDGHLLGRPTNKSTRKVVITSDEPLPVPISNSVLHTGSGLRVVSVTEVTPGLVYHVVTESTSSSHTATLTINAGTVFDAVGNSNANSAAISWVFDGIRPVISDVRLNNTGLQMVWTGTFSEDVVVALGQSAIVTDGLLIQSLLVSPRAFELQARPTRSGQVSVQFGSGVVKDAADNLNEATITYYATADTEGPVVAITSPQFPSTSLALIKFFITFDELLKNDLLPSNLTLTNCLLDPVAYPSTYFNKLTSNRLYEIQVLAQVEGVVSVAVPAGVVTDIVNNPNKAGSMSVTYSATFVLSIAITAATKADQKLVTVTSNSPIANDAITADVFQLAEGGIDIEATSTPNEFLLHLNPAKTSARVTIPSGVVTAIDGRTNRASSILYTYAAMSANATFTPVTTEVTLNRPVVTRIVWNIAVVNFSLNDLEADIRETDLIPVPSNGLVGSFTGFSVVNPGYEYLVEYIATAAPNDINRLLHIWHERDVAGTKDRGDRAVTIKPYCTFPFAKPFGANFSSPAYPATENRYIDITVTFEELLTDTLSAADFEFVNCDIDSVAYPGTHFTPGSTTSSYTMRVYALEVGNVEVRLPAGVAESESGLVNAASSILIEYLGPGKFLLNYQIMPGDKEDIRYLYFSVDPTVTLDMSQITLSTLQYDSAFILLEEIGTAVFKVTLRPGAYSVSVVAPEGEYVAEDSRFNAAKVIPFTWNIQPPKPTIQITQAILAYPTPLQFNVSWSAKVANFDKTNLIASLRNAAGSDISGFNAEGTISDLVVSVAGYAFSGTFTLTGQPTTDIYPFRLRYTPTGSDVVDAFGVNTTRAGSAEIPVQGPLTITITSDQYPETTNSPVWFRVKASQDLAANLVSGDLTLTNCTVQSIQVVNAKRDFYVLVTPTTGGDVTVQLDAGAVTTAEGTPNNLASLTVVYTKSVPLEASILDLSSRADTYTLRVKIPTGFVLGDLQTNRRDLVTAEITRNTAKLTYLGEVVSGYIDWKVETYVTLMPGRKVRTRASVYIPDQLFSKAGLFTQSAIAELKNEAGQVDYEKDLVIDIHIDGNTDLAVGDTVTISGTSNIWLKFYQSYESNLHWRVKLEYYENGAAKYGQTYWHTPDAITFTAATEVEEGYEWTIDMTIDTLPMRYEDLPSLFATIPALAIPYDAVASGGYPNTVYAETRPKPSGNTTVSETINANWPFELSNLLFREQLDIAAVNSSVEFDWRGRSYSDLSRDLIVDVYCTAGELSAGDVITINWGDASQDVLTLDDVDTEIDPLDVIPSPLYRFKISHTYASSASATVTVDAADITYRIYGVHVANFGSANELVLPNESTECAITRIQPDWSYDLRSVTLGANTSGMLASLQGFGFRSLLRYSGCAVLADNVIATYKANQSGTYAYKSPFAVTMKELVIATAAPIMDVINNGYLEGFVPASRLNPNADKFHVLYTGNETIATVRAPDSNGKFGLTVLRQSAAVDIYRESFKVTGPYNVILEPPTTASPKQGYAAIELNEIYELACDIDNYSTVTSQPPVLNSFKLTGSPTGGGSQNTVLQLPVTKYTLSNGQWQGLRSIEVTDHYLTQQEEYDLVLNLHSQIMNLTIDELPQDVSIQIKRANDAGVTTWPSTLNLVTQIRNRLQSLGKPNAFVITVV